MQLGPRAIGECATCIVILEQEPPVKSMLKQGLATASFVSALMLLSTAPASAQTGKELYLAKGCVACHGADGKVAVQPTYPKLAGQNEQYLSLQLKAFKSQERKGGQAVLMLGMASQLDDADIQKISAYLAAVK